VVVGLLLCGRDRPARQPLAVHIISQITFMVGSGGKLRHTSKSCLSSHFAYTRVVSYSSGGEWKLGNLGQIRIVVLNLVIKAFAFDYADSILARRNRLFEEDYE